MSRFDRKALRGPDAFQRETAHVARTVRAHWPAAAGAGVAALALVAGGLWWSARNARLEGAAAAEVAAALAAFDGGEPGAGATADPAAGARAALPSLRQAAVTYQGTPAGGLAQLYVGHALLRSGEAKGAEAAYEIALAVAPNDLARDAARMGLGHARLRQGDGAGAVDAWLPLTEPGRPYRALAWLDLARAYEAIGRPEEARKAYGEGTTLLRGSPAAASGSVVRLAGQRLTALAGTPAPAAGDPQAAGSPPAR